MDKFSWDTLYSMPEGWPAECFWRGDDLPLYCNIYRCTQIQPTPPPVWPSHHPVEAKREGVCSKVSVSHASDLDNIINNIIMSYDAMSFYVLFLFLSSTTTCTVRKQHCSYVYNIPSSPRNTPWSHRRPAPRLASPICVAAHARRYVRVLAYVCRYMYDTSACGPIFGRDFLTDSSA